jgi:uncharacterized protein with FMN-binding domain
MAQGGSGSKVANSLVAASAAAVLAVYAAGYTRTRSAADQFDAQSVERRPVAPDARSHSPAAPEPQVPAGSADAGNLQREPAVIASLERSQPAVIAPASVSKTPDPVQPANRTSEAAVPAIVEQAPEVTVAPFASSAPIVAASSPTPVSFVPTPVAPAPAPAVAAAPEAKWKDGTYTGWGTCRHGDIQAQVVIEGGRIQVATIAQCLTRYSCNVIGRLPPEVAQRQSAEVDYVSGATQSANAFYYAVLDALAKAK